MVRSVLGMGLVILPTSVPERKPVLECISQGVYESKLSGPPRGLPEHEPAARLMRTTSTRP